MRKKTPGENNNGHQAADQGQAAARPYAITIQLDPSTENYNVASTGRIHDVAVVVMILREIADSLLIKQARAQVIEEIQQAQGQAVAAKKES